MKLSETYLVRQWRAYAGPKDERLEAENNKIYRTGFMLLSVGVMALSVYRMISEHVAWVHSGAAGMRHFSTTIDPLLIWFLLVLLVLCVMQARRGFVETNRFGQTDTFPTGYFSLCSGLVGLCTAIILWVMRCVAEAQLFGFGEVLWFENLIVAAFAGLFCGALTLVLFYLHFRSAKRGRDQIEADL